MNPVDGRRIEIFEPFSAAFELTKLILFQPFDLGKWFTIGFAAFLAHLGGGGANFNYNPKFGGGDWNWKFRSATHDVFGSSDATPAWLIPVIIVVAVAVIAFVLVMMWLGARGKFIFTDSIVRNRGAIVEPWHEFKRQGNSLFLFELCLVGGVFVVLAPLSLFVFLPAFSGYQSGLGVVVLLVLFLFAVLFLFLATFLILITKFMIPVMYRRRCGAMEAFRAGLKAMSAHPGPVILYFLFSIVLWLAVIMIRCASACVTCCLTAVPYLGTVILLPLFVFMMSYSLLFVRQFGDDYDPWASLLSSAPIAPEPPPIQT